MHLIKLILSLLYTLIFCTLSKGQNNEIQIVGAMKNVMWKNELQAIISLDSVQHKSKYLYGMGPLEYLSGEITIFDGKAYKSTVLTDSTMIVEETFAVKAPFFGYGRVKKWKQIKLPSEINSMSSLENYLEKNTKSSKRPFFFKLHGEITYAKIHIMNLPKGTEVTSPDIAHNTQVDYHIENVDSDIIGFFSTDHKTIFTHHDTYLHMHLITKDRQKMGHIDDLIINPKKVLLFVPK